jgi:hypothetical protein
VSVNPPISFHATASLRHLAQRRRLAGVHAMLPEPMRLPLAQLRRFARDPLALDGAVLGEANGQLLLSEELIAPGPLPAHQVRLPFVFVRAINLELSYSCNLACQHCLQTPLRPRGIATWLDLGRIQALLQEALDLDLLASGLNVTGGETFAAGSPVLEVLAMARDLHIPTRANTNAWWGLQRHIRIGPEVFADDEGVLAALHRCGLGRLAMSLDDRYSQYPELLERVIRVATLCEQRGQSYEFVATGCDPALVDQVSQRLRQACGSLPLHGRFTPMETVDIGAAEPRRRRPLRTASLASLARQTPCHGAGFHRPYYLHVAPDGGLRSCLYAPGAGWHGHIHRHSLKTLLNAAAANPVLLLFESGELDVFVKRYLDPWRHHYRQVEHGCGAAALIARLAERIIELESSCDGLLDTAALDSLHRQLAAEMGLAV